MAYIANTPDDVRVMLDAVGIESLDHLFDMIPPEYRLDRPLAIPEAGLRALTVTRRLGRVAAAGTVHPEYRQILATYLANLEPEVVTVAPRKGRVEASALAEAITDETAAVVIQQPNFFGQLEDVE